MEMQRGKADEKFVQKQLGDIWLMARIDASFELLEIIAKHVGVEDINGLSVREFVAKRRREIAESLLADMADTFPAVASQIKAAWEKFDRERGH